MKILLLGTGGYHPNERRHTPCMLLPEPGVMLDAGTGLFRAAARLVRPQLDIFLTHAHLDHVIGLTFLLSTLHRRPLERVRVHALPEVLRAVADHLFAPAVFPVKPPFEMCPLPAVVELPGSGLLRHFPLEHPGGSIGYRLDWPGSSMAYVTDTTASADAPYWEHVRGVDLLLHECYLPDSQAEFARKTGHSVVTPVAELARRAQVGRLVLIHLNPLDASDDPVGLDAARAIFPATTLGEDGMEITF